MDFTEEGFNRARSKMLKDFSKAIADAEELRKAEAQDAGDEAMEELVVAGEQSEGAHLDLASVSAAPHQASDK